MANLQLSYDALDIQLKVCLFSLAIFPKKAVLKKKTIDLLVDWERWQTSAKQPIEVENGDFLNNLGAKKHLRYLSLQGISRITTLPSIARCVNLEILNLRACHNLESLPSDIGSLRKLTHLDVSQCFLLEGMPKGIEKLSSLQVLKGFVIGHTKKNLSKLGDLVQLKKLRKLSIQVGSNAVIKEDELEEFKKIITFRVLTISWGKVALASKNVFLISTKVGDTSPEWLKPSNLEGLKKLYIRGGKLDALHLEENEKWKVKILRLKYLKNLKIEAEFLQQNFPNLVYFEKFNCHEIGRQSSELIQYEKNVEWNNDEAWEALYEKLKPTSTSEEEKLKSTSTLKEKKLDVNEKPQIKTWKFTQWP
ncbi:Disease resistance RPP13-like protein 4 [Camellia lanceoleosa]|uniref:Disease resistance RPP13-like protein 4 n=1 Tax=Camellia lanceoleosa TaxID=1840588 RepID=A0ACC0H4Y9_9ERIC|nr:Disease resistance RPP13-like protein 4 [Camellia lanceoleosa]